jgi:tetratricopeptide (TPR) repeat protein
MKPRRSERPGLVVALVFSTVLLFVLPACVQLEDVLDRPYNFIETNLTASALEKQMQKVDEQYREPRTPKSVEYSLETAELSISHENGYEALWRAARACAWLARNLSNYSERVRYADKGMRIGKEATKRLSNRAEPYYYFALATAALCEARRNCAPEFVKNMAYNIRMAISLDERFDHAGGHRFLGKLITETYAMPIVAFATLEKGIEHLERAVALSPEFGENHLFLAEALIEDEQHDAARRALLRVLESPIPPDHTKEHDTWLSKAQVLLSKLPLDDVETVPFREADPKPPAKVEDIEGARPEFTGSVIAPTGR